MSKPVRLLLLAIALPAFALLSPANLVHAACVSPLSGGVPPVASDCLFTLRVAVGSQSCDLCECDADASGTVSATDALLCLRSAVGQSIQLQCVPCKDELIDDLPALGVDPPTPAGGTPVTVRLSAEGATSFTLTASGDGCGQFEGLNVTTGGGEFEETRNAGAFGECLLHADVQGGDGPDELTSSFTVEPTTLVLPAVQALNGIFTPGDLPAPTPGGPQIQSIEGPGTVINGGVAKFELAVTSQKAISQILVQVPTDPQFRGYFVVPATTENGKVVFQIQLDREFGSGTALQQRAHESLLTRGANSIDLNLQLIDSDGRIGAVFGHELGLGIVGTSDLQVSLSWDTPTDVDLHLVEPNGDEVYWGNDVSMAGGVLDLDSNAGCGIDNINNENITYADDPPPPPGEYIVRVDFWSNCEDDLPANYTVTTNVCGERTVYTGSFSPTEEDFGSAGSGREVARFFLACNFRVRGTATYEDHAQTTEGLATATSMPIRFAQVEVRRTDDDVILATGDTKQDGTFDILFENDGERGYYVLVKTKQANGVISQKVVNAGGEIYSVRSIGSIDEVETPDKTDLEIHALREGPGPAFNIFDVGVEANMFLKETLGVVPPELTWQWTAGEAGLCASVSCYRNSTRTISVLSTADDPDEYDDMVLLHEYGHFFQKQYSRSDSPGGSHSSSRRVDPRLAWGEGSATFFGSRARGSSLYLDTGPDGVNVRLEIENLSARIPRGTHNDFDFGNLSEALVAAILWDLADSTNEDRDTLSRQTAVFGALRKLGEPGFDTDGGAIKADLVDFLNAWFCLGHGERGDATSGIEGNVVGMHEFNYEFPALEPCP